mmetsp:Transcript_26875/g.69094  ORF Transcript_26875/g.69094 Transcript_26875/m.69094 type:complete len:436 (+) Transcript_26875:673-1980(+)
MDVQRNAVAIESTAEELTDANFREAIHRDDRWWLIQVYSNDDQECIKFKETWDEVVDATEDMVNTGRVNLYENPGVGRALRVQHLPYLILFRNGRKEIIRTMSAEAILDSLAERLDNKVSVISGSDPIISEEAEEFLEGATGSKVRVILATEQHVPPFSVLYAALLFEENIEFAMMSPVARDFLRKHGIHNFPALIIQRDHVSKPVIMEEVPSGPGLLSRLSIYGFPLLPEASPSLYRHDCKLSKHLCVILICNFDRTSALEREGMLADMRSLAEDSDKVAEGVHMDSVRFAYTSPSSFPAFSKYMGVREDTKWLLVAVEWAAGRYTVYSDRQTNKPHQVWMRAEVNEWSAQLKQQRWLSGSGGKQAEGIVYDREMKSEMISDIPPLYTRASSEENNVMTWFLGLGVMVAGLAVVVFRRSSYFHAAKNDAAEGEK